jgi:hypothetical protein
MTVPPRLCRPGYPRLGSAMRVLDFSRPPCNFFCGKSVGRQGQKLAGRCGLLIRPDRSTCCLSITRQMRFCPFDHPTFLIHAGCFPVVSVAQTKGLFSNRHVSPRAQSLSHGQEVKICILGRSNFVVRKYTPIRLN